MPHRAPEERHDGETHPRNEQSERSMMESVRKTARPAPILGVG
jgi:hypothetical protein